MKINSGAGLQKEKEKKKVLGFWSSFSKIEDIAPEIICTSCPLLGEILLLADDT